MSRALERFRDAAHSPYTKGEWAPKDQLPFRVLSHEPCRLCRELPYGLPGTLLLAAERSTRSSACAPFRWRAIDHSETLYRPLRVWNEEDGGLPRAAPCLVGFDVPRGIPMRPRVTLCRRCPVVAPAGCRIAPTSNLLVVWSLVRISCLLRELGVVAQVRVTIARSIRGNQ